MLINLNLALSAIQNGYNCQRVSVPVPRTFLNYVVLNQLYEGGYIGGFSISDINRYKYIVSMKYLDLDVPALKKFKIMSKPSQRRYMSVKDLRYYFSVHDFVLLQTSLTRVVWYTPPGILGIDTPVPKITGVITMKEALEKNFGGETLLAVV